MTGSTGFLIQADRKEMSCLRRQASNHYFRLSGFKQKIPACAGMTGSTGFLIRADRKEMSCLRMQASNHYFRLSGFKQKIPACA